MRARCISELVPYLSLGVATRFQPSLREAFSPESCARAIDAPGFVDRREQVTSVVPRERHAADMVLELPVPDLEASTQRLELGGLGQACFKQRLQVLIVGVHDTISRHGDKAPTERMHAQTVEVVCKACLGR